jgi:hypothetical protein
MMASLATVAEIVLDAPLPFLLICFIPPCWRTLRLEVEGPDPIRKVKEVGATKRENLSSPIRNYDLGMKRAAILLTVVTSLLIAAPAGASAKSNLKSWTNTYVAVSKSFLAEYQKLEIAMTTNNYTGSATICTEFQSNGWKLSTAPTPPTSALATLSKTAYLDLESIAQSCLVVVGQPSTSAATKLAGQLSAYANLATPILNALKNAVSIYG